MANGGKELADFLDIQAGNDDDSLEERRIDQEEIFHDVGPAHLRQSDIQQDYCVLPADAKETERFLPILCFVDITALGFDELAQQSAR